MEDAFVSLQEAAQLIGKSVQTVRRMVKRGELSAQRMKTPQGFQYVVRRDDLPHEELEVKPAEIEEVKVEENPENEVVEMLSSSTIQPTSQQAIEPVEEPVNEELTSQNENLINQQPKIVEEKLKEVVVDKRHDEIMALIDILGRLQLELDRERRRPRTLFAYIMDWLTGRS